MSRVLMVVAIIMLGLIAQIVGTDPYDKGNVLDIASGPRVIIDDGRTEIECSAIDLNIKGDSTHGFPFNSILQEGGCEGDTLLLPIGILLNFAVVAGILLLLRYGIRQLSQRKK